MDRLFNRKPEILKYKIHSCSSFSATYFAENILTDNPGDNSSRWSSDSNSSPQFLILELHRAAIVQAITFGKFERAHVCNLRKFKIYGGLSLDYMIELVDAGLKNDNIQETFPLKCQLDGCEYFACRYIKIVPLQTWGPASNFNYSIWFVQLRGCDDPHLVQSCIARYEAFREREAIRLCLKFLRQKNFEPAYEALQRCSNVQLEDPFISDLYQTLVENGGFDTCEQLLRGAVDRGLFDSFLEKQDYLPQWTPLHSDGRETVAVPEARPGMRGGHQMCIDSATGFIYLFGGWDGHTDLADLWAYEIATKKWSLLSEDTTKEGGPNARSCHKMVLDCDRRHIFTLGRYLDYTLRASSENLKSDFFMYELEANRWTLLCDDTASLGGPPLVFDHQMALDPEKHTLYVFGGRVLLPSADDRPEQVIFSGLYSYLIATNTWTRLRDDSPEQLRSRIGHSMLFHPARRVLYILAGQRQKELLADLIAYDVDSGKIELLADGGGQDAVPVAGFTQRATIDPERNEIHVFSGLSKDREKREEQVQNSFWIYNIEFRQWRCVYRNENADIRYWMRQQHVEPCPRYAHQLVFDLKEKVHYLFGGNPGKGGHLEKIRLDDFWALRLVRPSIDELLRKCVYQIRKQQFREMAAQNAGYALKFLQENLIQVVQLENENERNEFESLTALLFQSNEPSCSFRADRAALLDELLTLFPERMTPPRRNLVDLLPL